MRSREYRDHSFEGSVGIERAFCFYFSPRLVNVVVIELAPILREIVHI